MTEAEWLACDTARRMLGFLRGRASERKLRLFACARRARRLTGRRSAVCWRRRSGSPTA